jgi:glycosyltransferase involved in cell wall biosynthesis
VSKKILIHSLVFSPDGVSTAYLYNDIALKFKESGYEVVVLTTTPHYNAVESELKKQPLKKRALGLYYVSNFQGIKVKHVYQKKYKSTIRRLVGFVYWHLVSFVLALCEKKVDLILSPSPPLTIGFLNVLIAKLKHAKVIYNVQEIYPDLLIEEGGLKSGFIISFLKWLERFVYNKSDAVTTIDQIFYKTIETRFKDRSKLYVIPNFVDTDIYKPLEKETFEINKDLFPDTESLKIMYAGNIGHAQDWEPLIALADELKDDAVEFFVIGEGAMKDKLLQEKASRGLNKLHIIPYQPRELMPSLIAYSDLQFIFMASQTEGHGFPSKVYTIMACAKPLIVSSGENTPIINFLKDKDCAFLLTKKDLQANVAKMADILRNTPSSEFVRMGKNGYIHIANNYSKEKVTSLYVELISGLLVKNGPGKTTILPGHNQ